MSMPLIYHSGKILRSYRAKETVKIKKIAIPAYLTENVQNVIGLVLPIILVVMLNLEPILFCGIHLDDPDFKIFTTKCQEADGLDTMYGFLAMSATFIYFSQLADILVISMKVSAYYLVCMRMVIEAALSLVTIALVTVMISAALSCLEHKNEYFDSVPSGFMALIKMLLGMFPLQDYQDVSDDGIIFALVAIYLLLTVIFLVNVLIAQFNSAYDAIYQDMVGYARLKRIKIVVETIPLVTAVKWQSFVGSLAFDTKLEFNDGDVGLSGGYATTEAANLHPTTEERIERFGGSTEVTIPFPDTEDNDEDNDRFGRLEKVILRTLEKLSENTHTGGKKGDKASLGQSGSGSHNSGAEQSGASQAEDM
jgi:hypothetical protein